MAQLPRTVKTRHAPQIAITSPWACRIIVLESSNTPDSISCVSPPVTISDAATIMRLIATIRRPVRLSCQSDDPCCPVSATCRQTIATTIVIATTVGVMTTPMFMTSWPLPTKNNNVSPHLLLTRNMCLSYYNRLLKIRQSATIVTYETYLCPGQP